MTCKTYTQIATGETPPAEVIPVEIPAPPCPTCTYTISHSASMVFYEERDTDPVKYPDFPFNKPM